LFVRSLCRCHDNAINWPRLRPLIRRLPATCRSDTDGMHSAATTTPMHTVAPTVRSNDGGLKHYSPLVRRLAHQMIAKLPANVEVDDLIQVGMMGLADALARFDAEQGVMFETFATQRIRGAMLDELRGNDWMSRGDRRQQRSIDTAVHALEQRLGRAPHESEIAAELEMSLADYQAMLARVRGTQLVYLEDLGSDDDGNRFLDRHVAAADADGPVGLLQDRRMREAVVAAIKRLPEREQHVMSMYYEQDMNLKEIAAVLGVTESRVCQLHSQSIGRLRAQLRDW
jgi:RNA polymerase sigma factor for flagellar operon FliA